MFLLCMSYRTLTILLPTICLLQFCVKLQPKLPLSSDQSADLTLTGIVSKFPLCTCYLMFRQPKFTWYCCNNNQYFIFDNLCTQCLLRAVDVILPVSIRTTFPFASLVVTAIYLTRTSNSPTSISPFWIISTFIFLRVTMEACFWTFYLHPVQLSQDILSLGWNISLYPMLISMCFTTR